MTGTMHTYDPDTSPTPVDWLGADEGERIELVFAYHLRGKVKLPNLQLHSVVHVVVENQIALGEEIVVDTLARLQTEGLSRHDAIHAIGSVLAEHVYELMQEDGEAAAAPYRRYLDRLRRLTAESWRTGSDT
jgi:hypothetical protein